MIRYLLGAAGPAGTMRRGAVPNTLYGIRCVVFGRLSDETDTRGGGGVRACRDQRGLWSADVRRRPIAGRASGFGGQGSAATHAGDPGGDDGPRRQVSRRRRHRDGSGRRLCGVIRRLGGRDLQPLGSGGRQADHVQSKRGAAGKRWEAVAPLDPGGGRHARLPGRRQSLPPAQERAGRVWLRAAVLPFLHEIQPGACPDSPLRKRADRLPAAYALGSGRGGRTAEGRCPLDHPGRAGRLHQLEPLQLLARDGRQPASGSDVGECLRVRRAAAHRSQGAATASRLIGSTGSSAATRTARSPAIWAKDFHRSAPGFTTSSNLM